MRSISNMVNLMGNQFDINIVCRDRDMSDLTSYHNVLVDRWVSVGNAQVHYTSPKMLGLLGMFRILRDNNYDLIYINSFFSFRFSGLPMLLMFLGFFPRKPCLISPRGEFSKGAITLKWLRKYLYIKFIKIVGLYRHVNWQASSNFELIDICREFSVDASSVFVSTDLPSEKISNLEAKSQRGLEPLRMIFISRISPKKNLDYLLRVLQSIVHPIRLTIQGPIECEKYWTKCKNLINDLPGNIEVFYRGEVLPEKVEEQFFLNDVFVFPTLGENFGHVIFESLAAGTPVLVSDETPWQSDSEGGLISIPLNDPAKWLAEINRFAVIDDTLLFKRQIAAQKVASEFLNKTQSLVAGDYTFNKIVNKC